MTEYNTLAEALDAKKVKTAQGKRQSKHLTIGATVPALTPEQISAKYADRRRTGKTGRDHANGNPQRNVARKLARADWQKSANKNNPGPFPV